MTAAVALAAVAFLLTACMIPEETSAFNLINRDRAANGVPSLSVHGHLVTKAQNWATYLASNSGGICHSSRLKHSNLADGVPAGWLALGENVGCTAGSGPWQGAVNTLQGQFMGSSGHRANIVNGRYNYGGVGLSMFYTGPNTWVVYETQVFAQF
jgi:uncharacterized protein YkwD